MPVRRLVAGIAAVLGVPLLVVLAAAPAGAHAALESSTPFDGEQVASPPSEVVLDFDEPVTVAVGGVRVHDRDGEPLATTTSQAQDVVTVDLPDELPAGGYVVTYRVVSADGHPIDGALVFTVAGGDGVPDAVLQALTSDSRDRAWGGIATLVRWLAYVGALLAAGAVAFARWVDREGEAPAVLHRGAVLATAATVVALPVQAALTTGRGLAASLDPATLVATGTSLLGLGVLARLVGLAVLLAVGRGDRSPSVGGPLALTAAVAVLGSFLLDGHTVTTGPSAVVVTADAVHLAAGAAWLGGLASLAPALRRARGVDRPVDAALLVRRFSTLATVALAGVVLAGSALTWAEVRVPRALVTTPYGWALVAKLVLAGVAIALGAHANRRLVPAVADALVTAGASPRAVVAGGSAVAPPTEPPTDTGPAWERLRRTVRAEVAVLVVVLLATAVLVNLRPAAEVAGVTGAYSTYVPLGDDHELNLVVDPNRAGRNEVHLYVLDDTGRPATDLLDARLSLRLPAQDIGPLQRDGVDAGPGHWVVVGDELAVPGRWVVDVTVGVSRFEELRAEVPVTVNP